MSEEKQNTDITEIEALIREHADKLRYHQSFGSPADRVKSLLSIYEDKTADAYRHAKQFRDDMLVYFRALIIILDMTGSAHTHAEKNARLRGAVELLERMVEELRRHDYRVMFSHFSWRDSFASDLSTRSMAQRIRELEAENAALRQPSAPDETSSSERAPF